MQLSDFLGLLGGLALFLYGMQMMSDGLEDAAGNKMKQILEKLTSNRILGVLVGAGITAVIQSSSATTVMVVGFVNSGMMSLQQAVWIIMGANIGTTITGQLISLKVTTLAPLFAFFGVVMISFVKNKKVNHIGKIIAGLGVLFIGMNMMGDAMKPLRSSEEFISIMTTFSNPLLGILAGAVFTAIIQSSSASIGILQTLADGGLIAFESSVFVLFGQNIGTCITAALASVGTNRNAKRTTIIHLMFNVIGTTVFTAVCLLFPFTDIIAAFTPGNPAAQIANMHTFFNVATTLLLIPFGTLMAKAAEKILPDTKEDEAHNMFDEVSVGRSHLGYTAIHTDTLLQEVGRMSSLTLENLTRSFDALINGDDSSIALIDKTEDVIDTLNKDISLYISKTLSSASAHPIASIEEYYSIAGNIERIADHAHNIGGYVRKAIEKGIRFSEDALAEIRNMKGISTGALSRIIGENNHADEKWLGDMEEIEQEIDDLTEKYREGHILRMKKGLCSEEGAILYTDLLTDFERIGDHIMNIAESYANIAITENN